MNNTVNIFLNFCKKKNWNNKFKERTQNMLTFYSINKYSPNFPPNSQSLILCNEKKKLDSDLLSFLVFLRSFVWNVRFSSHFGFIFYRPLCLSHISESFQHRRAMQIDFWGCNCCLKPERTFVQQIFSSHEQQKIEEGWNFLVESRTLMVNTDSIHRFKWSNQDWKLLCFWWRSFHEFGSRIFFFCVSHPSSGSWRRSELGTVRGLWTATIWAGKTRNHGKVTKL